jgi:hypothetical protein
MWTVRSYLQQALAYALRGAAALAFLLPGWCLAIAQETAPWRLQVFTSANQQGIAADAIGLRLTGKIAAPLDQELRSLLLEGPRQYNHVVLELDSEGGELEAVKRASEVLTELARTKEFTTRVMGGGVCASGCVVLFMQGQKRKASGASVWVFHGACREGNNIPSLSATIEYLDLLEASGVSPDFTCELVQKGYVTSPGNFFLSGFELYHNYKSNIITELLPSWQPEKPVGFRVFVPR